MLRSQPHGGCICSREVVGYTELLHHDRCIGLLPTQVEECLRVATRILNETRLDKAVTFGDVRVGIELHDLEVGLLKQAIASDIIAKELINGSALILLVIVSIFAIDIKDDLANWSDKLTIQFGTLG